MPLDLNSPYLINGLYAYVWGFPGGSVVKNPPASAGNSRDVGSIPRGGKIPWRRKWQPIRVFLPGKSHGERSLVGQSPQGRKELDEAECVHVHTHTYNKVLKNLA